MTQNVPAILINNIKNFSTCNIKKIRTTLNSFCNVIVLVSYKIRLMKYNEHTLQQVIRTGTVYSKSL